MKDLVSTHWLAQELGANDLCVVDASAFLPEHNRDARDEYAACHIPGARFMRLDEWVDSEATLSNTLPPAEKFARLMHDLGLGDDSRIVLYDDSPIRSATRAWFMMRLFGARQVALLDGGIAKWKAEGRALAQGFETPVPRSFTAHATPALLRSQAQVLANVASGAEHLIDARGAARFTGAVAETRPGLASGHIPGARNLPYTALFAPDGTWAAPDALRAAFDDAGIDLDRPLIATCGSGMTANVVLFAAHLLGHDRFALYDGSWAQWGADPALPVETGPAR